MKYLLELKDLEINKVDNETYRIEVSEDTVQFLSHYLSNWIIVAKDRIASDVDVIIDRKVSDIAAECLKIYSVDYLKNWAIHIFKPYLVIDDDDDDEMIMKLAWDGR